VEGRPRPVGQGLRSRARHCGTPRSIARRRPELAVRDYVLEAIQDVCECLEGSLRRAALAGPHRDADGAPVPPPAPDLRMLNEQSGCSERAGFWGTKEQFLNSVRKGCSVVRNCQNVRFSKGLVVWRTVRKRVVGIADFRSLRVPNGQCSL
jgi:hypothetical protein